MADERKEAPEGIVLYSFSGDLTQYGFTKNFLNNLLDNKNIGIVGENAFIDYTDNYGQRKLTELVTTGEPMYVAINYKNHQKYVLSKSYIETIDLLSEGKIKGLVSGNYIYSGNIGEIGWRTANFTGFSVPTGTDSNGNSFENSRWLRSIYYNETPILTDGAQFNFQLHKENDPINPITFTLGLPNGANLGTLVNEETSSRGIGERLRGGSENAKIYRILNKNCRGIIVNMKIPSLSRTSIEDGSVGRTKIAWDISFRPLFSNINKQSDFSSPYTEVVYGKITLAGGYIRSSTIDFFSKDKDVSFVDSPNFYGWEIKIIRTTPDSVNSFIQNPTLIDSITELYGNNFTYPYCAVVKNLFNAEFFASIPERAFEIQGIEVKIPGNYNPITRNYSTVGFATTNGYWNGEFTTGKQWTNNPAWCFYDLINNKRYGLGKYLNDLDVDKFTLYNIAQYCDELVYDGDGGLEPRFTCNTWIAGREDAYNVLNDLSSCFRGMFYYTNGNLYSCQDSPKEPRVTFTNDNVENGDFNYTSSSKKNRQSIAKVRYNNPKNFYKPEIEYIEDVESIRKYGIREVDLTAFACTSRGQAIRLGRWVLFTNNLENETTTFTAGLEGAILRPGDVFKVNDINRKTKKYGGRVWNIINPTTYPKVTLDSPIDLQSGIEYKLSVLSPSWYYDESQISGLNAGDFSNIRRSFLQDFIFSGQSGTISGGKTVINLNSGFNTTDYNISGYPIWSVELAPNSINYTGAFYFVNSDLDYYRVLNIKETDVHKYEVVGVKYSAQKYSFIDSGISYQKPFQNLNSRIPTSPSDLSLEVFNNEGKDLIRYTFLVNNYNYINSYKVYTSTGVFGNGVPDNQYLVNILPVNIVQSIYYPPSSGTYNFRIYSHNESDNIYSSSYASNSISISKDLPIRYVTISNLELTP